MIIIRQVQRSEVGHSDLHGEQQSSVSLASKSVPIPHLGFGGQKPSGQEVRDGLHSAEKYCTPEGRNKHLQKVGDRIHWSPEFDLGQGNN